MVTLHRSQWLSVSLYIIIFVFVIGCVSKTSLSPDIAKESSLYGNLSRSQALEIVRTKARIGGSDADYGSLGLDMDGFSYQKTTKKTITEPLRKHKGGKPIKRTSKSTRTTSVPWEAISKMTPQMLESEAFGQSFRLKVGFTVNTVKYSARVKEDRTLDLKARSYEDLVDLVAAIKLLSGR